MTQPSQTLQPITNKQQQILEHIFTYRFLTIKHLLTFFTYKDKRYIQTLLNDLIAKDYIYQDYDSKATLSGAFATYCIAVNGVRYIRSLGYYPEGELRKRYPDKDRSKSYTNHCLLMATCCADLQTSSDDTKTYTWIPPTDYAAIEGSSETAIFLREQQPHLFFQRTSGGETVQYAIEHIYNNPQAYRIRSRLQKLINDDLYQGKEKGPILLILCDSLADLIYVKRYARGLIRSDHLRHPVVRAALTEQLLSKGTTSPIWEEVEA